jgi:hypothetical protein
MARSGRGQLEVSALTHLIRTASSAREAALALSAVSAVRHVAIAQGRVMPWPDSFLKAFIKVRVYLLLRAWAQEGRGGGASWCFVLGGGLKGLMAAVYACGYCQAARNAPARVNPHSTQQGGGAQACACVFVLNPGGGGERGLGAIRCGS